MAAEGEGAIFETVLRFAPIAKKVPVEMDWKDYDGLGFLSGRNWEDVEQGLTQALFETHSMAGVPLVELDAGDLTAEALGAMFRLLELSNALSALLCGYPPLERPGDRVRQAAIAGLRQAET